jgi:1-deoxyxylulose-5-phosphate synthase
LALAQQRGWTPFVSMQNFCNLLYREEEREMLPLCADAGIAVLPWSPLARGRLARPWTAETPRTKTDTYASSLFAATEESDRKVADQAAAIAQARGMPRAQVAIAWLAQKSAVTAPIIGVSKLQHLDDAVAALELKLTAEEIARLEAPYVPHPVAGHS